MESFNSSQNNVNSLDISTKSVEINAINDSNKSLNIIEPKNSTSAQNLALNKVIIDNFEFPIGVNDILFVLTRNNSKFKQGITQLTSKMIIINDLKYIELIEFSKIFRRF